MTEEKGRQLILADGKHSADEEREAIQYCSICAAMR
jgi:LacI family asc operon transcriptional repressor